MRNLELLTPDGIPNYAAYLLADENGISLQIAKYADTTRVNLVENRDYGRCSLVRALKAILDRMAVENTIYTKIDYPLRKQKEMIDSISLREAVINAIVHNDYSYGATPKFEFFSDRLEITSMGGLPYGVSEEDFFSGLSVPRNKEIMRVLRDLELVEHLGSGIPRILSAYSKDVFEIHQSLVRVTFPYSSESVIPESARQVPDKYPSSTRPVLEELASAGKALSRTSLQEVAKFQDREHFVNEHLRPLLNSGLIEMTIPDKPRSNKQKYRLTEKGRAFLERL